MLLRFAGGAEQDGNDRVPHGPTFFTPEWRELYKHCLREAHRLGLEMSLNIQSGWNLGGPMVKPEQAPKKLVWSELRVQGPVKLEQALPTPEHKPQFYRDLFVLAYRLKTDAAVNDHAARHQRRAIQNWEEKALYKALPFLAPDKTRLQKDLPAELDEEDTRAGDVIDLTSHLAKDGVLQWDVPDGAWEILRFGCTLNDHFWVSTESQGWQGLAIDPIDREAFKFYWNQVVEPLIADAGPLACQTLKYLHTDSWEVEVFNWTPTLPEEFRKRRGYDLLPFLPVMAGRIVEGRAL